MKLRMTGGLPRLSVRNPPYSAAPLFRLFLHGKIPQYSQFLTLYTDKTDVQKMLILTRKAGEAIFIETPVDALSNNRITVTVLGVRGNQVRIGIAAPKEVAVYREEIYTATEQASEEQKEAVA